MVGFLREIPEQFFFKKSDVNHCGRTPVESAGILLEVTKWTVRWKKTSKKETCGGNSEIIARIFSE